MRQATLVPALCSPHRIDYNPLHADRIPSHGRFRFGLPRRFRVASGMWAATGRHNTRSDPHRQPHTHRRPDIYARSHGHSSAHTFSHVRLHTRRYRPHTAAHPHRRSCRYSDAFPDTHPKQQRCSRPLPGRPLARRTSRPAAY